jgi:hypothetical protein
MHGYRVSPHWVAFVPLLPRPPQQQMNSSVPLRAGPIFLELPDAQLNQEHEMTYRISYIDTSASRTREPRMPETVRTEDHMSAQAALVRAREVLERADCQSVLVSDGVRERAGSTNSIGWLKISLSPPPVKSLNVPWF